MYKRTSLSPKSWQFLSPQAERLAVVFVHGWRGHPLTTWLFRRRCGLSSRPTLMMHLLMRHNKSRLQYFSFGHSAGRFFSPARAETLAQSLTTFLRDYVYPYADGVALVAHSLGGLVCRRAILNLLDEEGADSLRVHAILMLGTPNDGASLARIPLPSRVLQQLRRGSDFVSALNRDWIRRVLNGGNPGESVSARAALVSSYVVGNDDRVVGADSAAAMSYLGNVSVLEKGHRLLPKASDRNDASFRAISSFLERFREASLNQRRNRAALIVSDRVSSLIKTNSWTLGERDSFKVLDHVSESAGVARRATTMDFAITTERRFVGFSQIFRVVIRLESVPKPPAVGFDRIVSRGMLDETSYAAIICGASGPLGSLLSVEAITAKRGGSTGRFTLRTEEGMAGAIVREYECLEFPESDDGETLLTLSAKTVIDRGHGWYRCYCPRTITGELQIDWAAPFRVRCRPRLGVPVAMPLENVLVDGYFRTTLVANGPVAPGSDVDFVFLEG